MKLADYRIVFVAFGLIGVLLIATPALSRLISLPGEAQFSELYLLGPGNVAANYPSNIDVGPNYSVYVGVGNQLGSSAYYVLYVKFGNETDQKPNEALRTPSSLQPLYEYRFSLQSGMSWENLLTFSIPSASISGNNSRVNTLRINGITFNVDKPASRDPKSNTFGYQLIFELWLYNPQNGSISFNNRFVDLQLNLTKTQ